MDYARDLGRVDVWEESLKRSLERRGRPRRSSVELYRLRPERDLMLGDVLERSASYSELRRRASQRTAMPRPSVALGGISAVALVAGATIPSLLGGARGARKERVAYAAAAHSRARSEAAVSGSWGSSIEAGGSSVQAAASSAGSNSRGSVSDASVSHSARRTGVVQTAAVTPHGSAQTVRSSSGGVAVGTPGGTNVDAHLASYTTSANQASPVVVHPDISTETGAARVTPHTGPSDSVAPSETGSSETVTPTGPSTVVQERPAPPGSGEQVSGGVPEGTTVPSPPVRTRGTTTPGSSTTPTTTTGNPPPAPNVQDGVNRMIAAGNQIATRPYVYGGGHGSFNSEGYDCSGSVSYVLHAAGLLRSPEDSTELESYGDPGTGRYVTVYANPDHAWMTIEGRRFDTVALAEHGSRWSNTMASTSGFVARHPHGY